MKKINKVVNFSILENIDIQAVCLMSPDFKPYKLTSKGLKKMKNNRENLAVFSLRYGGEVFSGRVFSARIEKGDIYYTIHKCEIEISHAKDEVIATVMALHSDAERLFSVNPFSDVITSNLSRDYNFYKTLLNLKDPRTNELVDFLKIIKFTNINTYKVKEIMDQCPRLFNIDNVFNYTKEMILGAIYTDYLNKDTWRRGYDLGGLSVTTTPDSFYTDAKDLPVYAEIIYPHLLMSFYEYAEPTEGNYYNRWSTGTNSTNSHKFMDGLHALSFFVNEDERLLEIITMSLENKLLDIFDIVDTVEAIKHNLGLILDVEDFIDYVYFNNYRPLLEISKEYLDVRSFNKTHGIKLSNPTQFSFETSLEKLKLDGFDPVAVELFGEMIDIDPIEALSLIQNKRKLSKKREDYYSNLLIDKHIG